MVRCGMSFLGKNKYEKYRQDEEKILAKLEKF